MRTLAHPPESAAPFWQRAPIQFVLSGSGTLAEVEAEGGRASARRGKVDAAVGTSRSFFESKQGAAIVKHTLLGS